MYIILGLAAIIFILFILFKWTLSDIEDDYTDF